MLVRQANSRLATRSYVHMGLTFPRPMALRRYSSQAFHERWGKAVLEAALASRIAHREDALEVLHTLTAPEAVALISLPLGTTRPRFYAHVGQLAQAEGAEAAGEFVAGIYDQYLKTPRRSAKLGTIEAASNVDASSADIPAHGASQHERPEFLGQADPAANWSHSPEGGMDLFNPETWLEESPTAKRLWKEGSSETGG